MSEQLRATQLMLCTIEVGDDPYMYVTDTRIELEEALPIAKRMHVSLHHDSKCIRPDPDKHTANWEDERDGCIREADEDDSEYAERYSRWKQWPGRKARQDADWLYCALVTTRALLYLTDCQSRGLVLEGKTETGQSYGFYPKPFYEYAWICLSKGLGTKLWKKPLEISTVPEIQGLVQATIDRWERGEDLGKMCSRYSPGTIYPQEVKEQNSQSFQLVLRHQSFRPTLEA